MRCLPQYLAERRPLIVPWDMDACGLERVALVARFVGHFAPPQVHVHQRLALILMAPFAVPGAWMLESMQNAGRLPHYLTAAWWWDPVVMSHQVWALLLLAVLLLGVMWQQQRAPALGNGIDSGSA